MKLSKENLLQLYIEGNLPSEAKPEFDRLVKEDALFCESLVGAVAQDLGPVPEGTLDQMTVRLDTRYDRIWRGGPSRFKMPSIPFPALRLPKVSLPKLSLPAIRLPRMTLPKVALPAIRLPFLSKLALPSVKPETVLFAGGVLLFLFLALIMVMNPFQGDQRTLEERLIQNFSAVPSRPSGSALPDNVSRAVEKTVAPVAKHAPVKPAVVPKTQPAVQLPPPLMEVPAAETPKTAEALVEKAFQAAPGGKDHSWIETSAPRTDLSGLPPLPVEEEAPASMTAQGNILRLSIPLNQAQVVSVSVADSSGKIVRSLYSGYWKAGNHTIDWDVKDDKGRQLKTGAYNVLVETGNQTHTQKITIQ